MRVHVLSLGDETTASTHFRFLQYADLLSARGIELVLVRRTEVGSAVFERLRGETVVLQKIVLRPPELRHLRACAGRLIFDFDDAIWARQDRPFSWPTRWRVRSRLARCLSAADAVTASSEHLAVYARRYTSRCHHVPMAIDTQVWTPRPESEGPGLVVGWAGAPSNLPFLERLVPPLERLVAERDDVEVRIYCGQRPELPFEFRHTQYSPGTEADFVRELDIGLCPLEDHEFARGKSPIKILQYLACGVPVAASAVGASRELLGAAWSRAIEPGGDWYEAISELASDAERRRAMRTAGREFVVTTHDLGVVADQLAGILAGGTTSEPQRA